MWWESEGEASVQVMLSEPAQAPVSVRYATSNGSAYAGFDFTGVEGTLTFAPGEVSKIVAVPVVDDGPGDSGEDFFLTLSDAAGARLGFDQFRLELNEGDAPPRVRFTDALMEADEAEPIFSAGIEVVPMHPVKIEGWGDVSDHSAYFSLDYRGIGDGAPWPYFSVPGGQAQGTVELEIIADQIPEPDEGFLVKTGWFPGRRAGRAVDRVCPDPRSFAASIRLCSRSRRGRRGGRFGAIWRSSFRSRRPGEVSVRYRSEPGFGCGRG